MRRPSQLLLILALTTLTVACGTTAPPPSSAGNPVTPTDRRVVTAQPTPTVREDATALPSIGDTATYESVLIRVEGLTCAYACPKEVRYQLEAVPGVVSCSVDFTSKTASCRVMPGTNPKTVLAGLRTPYSGSLIARR